MKQDTLRKGITYLFTFFIAFFLFTVTFMSVVRVTVMDESYFLHRMEEVAYYDSTATELNRIIKQQARAAGFEVETFDGFVKEEDLREAMISYEKQTLHGTSASIDTSIFKANMEKQIENYAAAKDIRINTSVQNALQQFVNECVSKYRYLTQFPYLDVYGQLMRLYQKAYLFAAPVITLITVGLLYLMHRLQPSKRRRRTYDGAALIGAGLLSGTAPAVLYATRFFEKIQLSPQYMYDLLVAITRNLLIFMMMAGLGMILAGTALAYVKRKRKVNSRHGKRNRVYPSSELLSAMERES